MAKPKEIELEEAGIVIPILYEDRSSLALDKPAGWMLAPDSWEQTARNLQLALQSSMNGGAFWAQSRNLKYLRYVHRLDAETSGVVLFAKSAGALRAYTELFEERRVDKEYLAVVEGVPKQDEWTCTLPLMPEPGMKGRMRVVRNTAGSKAADNELIKDAETHFRVAARGVATALVEARPTTGRTHQIRVHLAATGYPVAGDPVYGNAPPAESKGRQRLALRAWRLAFLDPFQKRRVRIEAPAAEFLREYGFPPPTNAPKPTAPAPAPKPGSDKAAG